MFLDTRANVSQQEYFDLITKNFSWSQPELKESTHARINQSILNPSTYQYAFPLLAWDCIPGLRKKGVDVAYLRDFLFPVDGQCRICFHHNIC